MYDLKSIINETKKLKLLYVEDNKGARKSTLDILGEFFEHIIIAINGEDGLEKFKSNKIDLIITDINMPKMNGLEMLKEIKSLSSDMVALVFSAYNEAEFFVQSIKIGVNGYLLKPINFDQFLSALETAIQRIEAKKAENLLLQYKDVTDSSSIMSTINSKEVITYVNDALCEISEYTKNELIGTKEDSFNDKIWKSLRFKKETWKGIIKKISKSGKAYYLDTTIKPILDIDGNILEYVVLRHNVTAIMNPFKQLNDLIESSSIPMIVLVKIESYDVIENFYGQKITQNIVNKFADKLFDFMPSNLGFKNMFVLRNGEYAFAQDKCHSKQAIDEIVQELLLFIDKINDSHIDIGELDYDISVIVSLSYGNNVLDDARHGIRCLLQTKHNFIIANDLAKQEHEKAEKNIEVLKMVKKAIETSKIVSYFQPIVDNKSKKIVKYESLVRLIDETNNILSPYFFLETSKQGKYYTQITSIVLDKSFEALEKVDVAISINISALDIEEKYICDKIFNLLKIHKKSAHRVIIELLEDEDFKDFEAIKSFISDVKKLGVRIAIDDFGSGYSNFERLLDYQPDIVKIDASLIKNIAIDKFSLSIVKTMVNFAKEQNIEVVAEYVENEAIYNILCELGVDYSQGYYFGKPEPL